MPNPQTSSARGALPITGDQQLLQHHFAEKFGIIVFPICTTKFLEPSANSYPTPWLAREIAQNFIDHNTVARGSLNGVRINQSVNGKIAHFQIEGDWKFSDSTGLTAPHSAKENSNIHRSAGGNGIGLKQVALRYLRDLNVTEFNIYGEGWVVKYELVKASELNAKLRSNEPQFKHDWLIAKVLPNDNHGKCIYEIKTSNPKVTESLQELHQIAVSSENTFLQNPNFANQHGSFKWHAPDDKSRLFINGQVFAYGNDKKTDWPAPACLTLNLTNVDYRMSIDRPAVSDYDLLGYARKLIDSMTKSELVEQLKQSSFLWTSDATEHPSYDRPFGFKFLEKIIDRLHSSHKYNLSDLQKDFPEQQFLAYTSDLSSQQTADIRSRGYILCPEYFKQLGVPLGKSLYVNPEAGKDKLPNSYEASSGFVKLALESGIQVATDPLASGYSSESASKAIIEKLGKWIKSIEETSEATVKITFHDLKITKEMLSHPNLTSSKPEHQALRFMRSVVLAGLKQSWLESAFLSVDGQKVTFGKDYDSVTEEIVLLTRITSTPSDGQVYLELARKNGNWKFDPPTEAPLPATQELHLASMAYDDSPRNYGKYALWTSTVALIGTISWLALSDKISLPSIAETKPQGDYNPRLVQQRQNPNPLAPYQNVLDNAEQLLNEAQAIHNSDKPADSISEAYKTWKANSKIPNLPDSSPTIAPTNTINEIVNEMNSANIDPKANAEPTPQSQLVDKLEEVAKQLRGPVHLIDNFRIVDVPTETELQKITYLRDFFSITTGIEVKNEFFVFTGQGAKGINLAKSAIGLHQELLKTSFEEALSTYIHEVAHNYALNHGNEFIDATESLNAKIHEYLQGMSQRASRNELSPADKALRQIRFNWYAVETK